MGIHCVPHTAKLDDEVEEVKWGRRKGKDMLFCMVTMTCGQGDEDTLQAYAHISCDK